MAPLSVDLTGGKEERDVSSHTVTLGGRETSSGDGGGSGGGCVGGSSDGGELVCERESEREGEGKRGVRGRGRGGRQIRWIGGGRGEGGEDCGEDERAAAERVVFEPLAPLHVAMFSYAQVRKRTWR